MRQELFESSAKVQQEWSAATRHGCKLWRECTCFMIEGPRALGLLKSLCVLQVRFLESHTHGIQDFVHACHWQDQSSRQEIAQGNRLCSRQQIISNTTQGQFKHVFAAPKQVMQEHMACSQVV